MQAAARKTRVRSGPGVPGTKTRATCCRPIKTSEVAHLEALGARLYTLRRDAELSRNGLAEAAEVSESTVERIERATRRTRRSTLERLAGVLHADAKELVDLAGPALAPESLYAKRVARRRARRWRKKRNRESWAEGTRTLEALRGVRAGAPDALPTLIADT
jgi:transcriptional regulator with XRE-family HTH domain